MDTTLRRRSFGHSDPRSPRSVSWTSYKPSDCISSPCARSNGSTPPWKVTARGLSLVTSNTERCWSIARCPRASSVASWYQYTSRTLGQWQHASHTLSGSILRHRRAVACRISSLCWSGWSGCGPSLSLAMSLLEGPAPSLLEVPGLLLTSFTLSVPPLCRRATASMESG